MLSKNKGTREMEQNRLTRLPAIVTAGLLLGLALTCLAPDPAAAQPAALNPEQACRDDAFRLCGDFIPDRTKVGACLRSKARALSRDCHTVIFGAGRTSHRTTHRRHRHHR
jgi:hypothetical protein